MGILLFAVSILAAYFAIRFYLLKNALRETDKELQVIQKDLTQNQVLHLPLPDHELEKLMESINGTLDTVRNERKEYAKREREFQSQIEAISHDLRTPLTVILGYLGFLQKQGAFTVEQKEMLAIMERKSRSMEKLISQFYDYSRLTASDYELEIEETDAGRILREVFAENCMILEEAHLNVQANFPNHPVWVEGEGAALERIFSNLFQNAGRYAYTFFNLEIKNNGSTTCVIFENDTKELSDADIPDLFERFYRKDHSRNQGGTGLGLTIAKCLAEEMNGELKAEIIERQDSSLRLLRLILCLKSFH